MLTLSVAQCGLLRTPRVYNALITSDQNLKPSQAFPVIQPHIQENPYIPYSFNAFNPYNPFDPYSQLSNLLNSRAYQTRKSANDIGLSVDKDALDAAAAGARNNVPTFAVGSAEGAAADRPASVDPLFPMNEFGLPPSLIPVNNVNSWGQGPVNLSPFPFNSYPLVYDQFNSGLVPGGYLPHFGYYPSPTFFPMRKPIEGGDGAAAGAAGAAGGASAAGAAAAGGAGMGFGSAADGSDNVASVAGSDGADSGAAASGASSGSDSGSDSSSSGSNGSSSSGDSGSGSSSSGSGGSSSSGGSSFSSSSSTRNGRDFVITDERIKNYPNKNKRINDVPPPPLPFGASRSDQ